MPIHQDTIKINGPIEKVFNYKTTIAFWPDYHPLSVKVEPFFSGPAQLGTKFTEVVKVLFIKQKFHWQVSKFSAPNLFQIVGSVNGFFGGNATITYSLKENNSVTTFTRTFEINRNNIVMKFLDWLILGRFADYDGKSAMKNLKKIIEQG